MRIFFASRTLSCALLIILHLCGTHGMAQTALVPAPKSIQMAKGSFSLERPYRVVGLPATLAADSLWRNAATEASRVIEYGVMASKMIPHGDAKAQREAELRQEAYKIHIAPDTVRILAHGPLGFLRAHQTLAQLLDYGTRNVLPCCDIDDAPAYPWRGVMLDLSRHYFPLSHLYRQVDALARYKINRLHLHLTDAAGWRMEIKRYPRLTQLAAWRTSDSWKTWWDGARQYAWEGTAEAHGGYYTQQEMRDFVRYAQSKGVMIIPEIEMPAHSEEVLTAYPELSCTHEPYKQTDFCPGSVATYDFLEHVLEEVIRVFPSPYIHVGGDEAAKASWSTCPLCQQKMKEEGFTDVAELQAYLIQHMNRFLASHGRKLIGWDEVLEGEKPVEHPATIMIWRGQEKAAEATRAGHDVILSPGSHCYFDNVQDAPATQPEGNGGYLPLEKVYGYDLAAGLDANEQKHILGVQGNLWTEYIPTPEHAEMMLYPRALALSEIGWSGAGAHPYADFRARAAQQVKALQRSGVHAFDLAKEVGERAEKAKPVQHKARGCKVTYHAPYSPQYAAAGEHTLTDGERGGWANNDGRWQGFITREGLDVTIDLGRVQKISSVRTDFQQVCNPWIFYPEHYTVSISSDGEHFTQIYSRERPLERSGIPTIDTWLWRGRATSCRYVRVKATTDVRGGWIFADEIVIN